MATYNDYHRLVDSDEPTGRIVYSLIARGQVVLTECAISAGNFPTITRVVLSKLANQTDFEAQNNKKIRKTYKYDSYMFHYMLENGITYLCLAENSVWHSAAFVFLEKLSEDFRNKIINEPNIDIKSSIPLSLDPIFKLTLKTEIETFNSNLERETKRNDMVNKVKKNIEDAKAIVVDNIEKILERGEKIELLVDKTDKMQQTAYIFESSARNLRNTMWWEGVKRWIMTGGICLFVIYFLFASYCGGLTLPDCHS